MLTYSGKVVVRPDQTYRHGEDSLYVPEGINAISWSPALFLHVCKPGRCVGARFAGRYYDGAAFGVLLYPEDLIDGSPESYASAICLNNTTYFPDFTQEEPTAEAICEGKELFRTRMPSEEEVGSAIEAITRICHIRTGDVIAIELAQREPLATRQKGQASLSFGKIQVSVIF